MVRPISARELTSLANQIKYRVDSVEFNGEINVLIHLRVPELSETTQWAGAVTTSVSCCRCMKRNKEEKTGIENANVHIADPFYHCGELPRIICSQKCCWAPGTLYAVEYAWTRSKM